MILPLVAAIYFFVQSADAWVNCSYPNKSGPAEPFDTHDCKCLDVGQACKNGLVIPMWLPVTNLSLGDKLARAFIYFIALLYLFLGVSIISDRFMAAIETITAQEKTIVVKKKSGETLTLTVRVWNDTVSNLTLMALGSSAPEILLSIIEVCGNDFKAGDLGPNTIVGSAAFNLFMIIAICVYVIPSNEVRRQKYLRVFFLTATWSVFAYVWLYLIIAVFSPGVVEIWEGLLTFIFFPLLVITAWVADRQLLVYKYLSYRKAKRGRGGVLTAREMGHEAELQPMDGAVNGGTLVIQGDVDPEVEAFEEHRREYMEILKGLRKRHPNMDLATMQQIAEYEMIKGAKKSRAFYRVQAVRRLTGGGNVVKKRMEKEQEKNLKHKKDEENKQLQTCRIFFDPAHYTVLENVGTLNVTVAREGGPPDLTVLVDYRTEDGSASGGSDYISVQGTLTFKPADTQMLIPIEVIDDDVFEEDEHFYVHLDNLRVRTRDGQFVEAQLVNGVPVAQLDKPATATVMILDDDHAGVFTFDVKEYVVSENAGAVIMKVMRNSGARGKVLLPYKTIDGTATGERDYETKEEFLEFNNDEVEKTISIGIVNDEEYEKTETFFVELAEPIWVEKQSDPSKVIERYKKRQRRKLGLEDVKKSGLLSFLKGHEEKEMSVASSDEDHETERDEQSKIADLGKPKLGEITKCVVKIKESTEFKGLVDRMIKTANISLVLGTSSWREQFTEALTVSAGEGDEEEGEGEEGGGEKEEKLPTCDEYVMHYLSMPWKLMCACCPPTEYWNGWACFLTSILLIGLFTAVIGDLANHFGCSIGLKDAVTAISFVAMGTSVPDTFASKVAAVQDKYADSSIGNVTGSNAVNVFLGIGIAWTLCSIVAAFRNETFDVDPGTLAFSVTIFCTEAVVAIGLILLRRSRCVGGELGGPAAFKYPTALFLVLLWAIYLLLSTLESYCIIKGF